MPAIRVKAAAVLFVLLAAGIPGSLGAPGQDGAPEGGVRAAPAGPRTEPQPDNLSNSELLSQNLTVRLYPENHSISVEGQVRVRANFALDKFTFYLYQGLDLLSIRQNGQELEYVRSGERLSVNLSATLPANGTTAFDVGYNGTMWYLESGKRQDCVGWEGAYVKGSTFWYLRHHPSDWAAFQLKLCCPPNWTAISDGELAAVERSAAWANYTWITGQPCLRPAFAAANYTASSRDIGGMNVTVYTYPEHSGSASKFLDESAAILPYYDGILGPCGRSSLKIVETAHETMTGYACSGFVMLYPPAFSGAWSSSLLAHELGHQWFPFATGYQGWGYAWLWEAFPEYLCCIFEISQYQTRNRLDKDRNAYLQVYDKPGLVAIRSSDWDTAYSYETVYAKGAWVLRMLHGILGDAEFRSCLRDYIDTFLYGYGSAQSFLAIAEAHSPVPLDDFWELWLNTTRYLDLSLPVARLYENYTAFRLELEPESNLNTTVWTDIGIEYTDGRKALLGRGWDGRAKAAVFDLPAGVRQVRLDPDGWLLDIDPNNQAAVPLRSGKLFDLQLVSLQAPPSISEGQVVELRARLRNNSSYFAGPVGVDFLVDGIQLASQYLNLSEGSEGAAYAAWRATVGPHRVTAVVDEADEFHEWDERNNQAVITVEVAPRPPVIDLAVDSLALEPREPWEGAPVNFSAILRNPGEAPLVDANLSFSLDGNILRTSTVPVLPPGGCATVGVAWKAERGFHRMWALADPFNEITEADEENNRAELSFFVNWSVMLRLSFQPERPRTLDAVTFTVEGNASECSFDFGDGGSAGWSSDRLAIHDYRDHGNYTVTVRGRYQGAEGRSSVVVPVSNRPPDADIWVEPYRPLACETVIFTSKALDLDGKVVSVLWELGDGSTALGPRAEHAYARPGRYEVRCTVTDDDGAVCEGNLWLDVVNLHPEVVWEGPTTIYVGEKARFRAQASDPDGQVTEYRWNFGALESDLGQVAEHTFRKAGRYLVSVDVKDDLGANTTFSQWVVVKDRPVTAGPFPIWLLALGPAAMCAVAFGWLFHRYRKERAEKEYRDFFRKERE